MAESGDKVRPANRLASSWWFSRSAVVPVIRASRPRRCARRYLGGIAEVQSGTESSDEVTPSADPAARSDELPDAAGAAAELSDGGSVFAEVQSDTESGAATPSEDPAARSDALPDAAGAAAELSDGGSVLAEVQSDTESGGAATPSEDPAARSDELPDAAGAAAELSDGGSVLERGGLTSAPM